MIRYGIRVTFGSLLPLFLFVINISISAASMSMSLNDNLQKVTAVDSTVPSNFDVQYDCRFENLWTKERHPNEYPLDAVHWTQQVLASHSDTYSMWESGNLASKAMRKIIERGNPSSLTEELLNNHGSFELSHPTYLGIDNGNFNFDHPIRVTSTNHLLSVIAKMAPSPDWFSGFHDFNMMNDASMTWFEEFTIETYPYDAGIDDGDTYYTIDVPTEPRQPISQLTVKTANSSNGVYLNPDGTEILPVSRYSCFLIDPDDIDEVHVETPQTVDSDIPYSQPVAYNCQFENLWDVDRHPKHFPKDNKSLHWTKQILAAHDSTYSIFREGTFASEAVEKLAELGGISDIVTELRAHDYPYDVGHDKYLSDRDKTVTFEPLRMTWDTPYISILSKISPSSDWFAGFHDFDTINLDTRTWYKEFAIPLFPYDAGTEDGNTYITVNKATDPVQPISKFDSLHGDNVFMKGNEILCVASLTCILAGSENEKETNPFQTASTTSPVYYGAPIRIPKPPTMNYDDNHDQQGTAKVSSTGTILSVTLGAIIVALLSGALICALIWRRREDKCNSNTFFDGECDGNGSSLKKMGKIRNIRGKGGGEDDISTVSSLGWKSSTQNTSYRESNSYENKIQTLCIQEQIRRNNYEEC